MAEREPSMMKVSTCGSDRSVPDRLSVFVDIRASPAQDCSVELEILHSTACCLGVTTCGPIARMKTMAPLAHATMATAPKPRACDNPAALVVGGVGLL